MQTISIFLGIIKSQGPIKINETAVKKIPTNSIIFALNNFTNLSSNKDVIKYVSVHRL